MDGGIDEIPLPAGPGRLWLCGKHAVGPDPEAALVRAGAATIVCLNEAYELADRYPDYVAWLRRESGERRVWFPVPDLHAPPLAEVLPLLDELHTRLDAGARLLVHCGAGIGRAGTVAALLLVGQGMGEDAALAHVAAPRPMAGPEAGTQRELVTAVARHRAAR
jgi:protein-tyrosine phosphatase